MHVCTILPHIKEYGGVRRYLEFGNSLIKKGHQNTLFVLDYDALANFKWIDELNFLGTIEPINRLTSEVFDACICGDASSLHYLDKVKAKLKIVNVISPPWTDLPMAKYDDYLNKEGVLVVGNSTGWNGDMSFRPHWDTIPGAVNTEMFHPVSTTKNANFSILFMAKHRPWKNLPTILKAHEILKDRNYSWGWFDTEKHPELPISMRSHLNVQQEDLAELFCRYHCFVSVETIAGWQNTAMEAMACGTAVVCTEIGTKDFAIDGKTAYILKDTTDHERLADYIETLASNATLRLSYGSNGVEIAQTLTWEKYTNKWISYLEKHLPEQNKTTTNVQLEEVQKNAKKMRKISLEKEDMSQQTEQDAILEKAKKLKNYIGDVTSSKKKPKKKIIHSQKDQYNKSLLTLVQNTKKVHPDCSILTVDAGSFPTALQSLKFKTYNRKSSDFKKNTDPEILLIYKILDILKYDTFNLIQRLLVKRKLETVIIGTTDEKANDASSFTSGYKELRRKFLLTYIKAPGGYFLIMENREIAIKKYLAGYNFHYTKSIAIEDDDTYDALIKIPDKVLQGITDQIMNLVDSGINIQSL